MRGGLLSHACFVEPLWTRQLCSTVDDFNACCHFGGMLSWRCFVRVGRSSHNSQQATDRTLAIELFSPGKRSFLRSNRAIRVMGSGWYSSSATGTPGSVSVVHRAFPSCNCGLSCRREDCLRTERVRMISRRLLGPTQKCCDVRFATAMMAIADIKRPMTCARSRSMSSRIGRQRPHCCPH